MIRSDKFKIDFEFTDPCLCNSWVGAAVIGAGAIGAGASIYGANKAADTQAAAAAQAAALQKEMYDTTRADLGTYRNIGGVATKDLTGRLSDLTAPISIDPDVLENSDYYKFASTQGQKAVQNAAAARGLGKSGAALKGAAAFAKGLATDTYKTAWDMENQNKSNAFNRLKSLVDVGENAAAMTGTLGEKAAYNQGTALVGGANAEAAADNRIGSTVNKFAGDIGGYAMYQGLYGGKSGGGGGYSPSTAGQNGSPYYGPAPFGGG